MKILKTNKMERRKERKKEMQTKTQSDPQEAAVSTHLLAAILG